MIKNNSASINQGCYINPILSGDYADPSVFREGAAYYMTHSSGNFRPGLLIWHSQNLVDWEPVCHAVEHFSGDIWAPDFLKYNGRYYIYFAASGTNWVTTSDSINGPWREPLDLKIGHIDPGHCVDAQGQRYLFLSGGNIVKLAPDGLSVVGEAKRVYNGWRYPSQWDVEGFYLESPKIFRRGDYYYLTTAEGGTAGPPTAHMAVAARARNLCGPWENSPYNPLVHCSDKTEKWWNRGHGTIIDSPDGRWWIVYHAYEKDYVTLGRKTLLEPIEWTADGWCRVPEGVTPDQPLRRPQGKTVPSRIDLSDDFTGPKPGKQWRFLVSDDPRRYRYTGKGLEILGKGRRPGEADPMTCITGDHGYAIATELDLQGDSEGGLVLFYNAQYFCGISLNQNGLTIYRSGEAFERIPCPAGKLHLKLTNDRHNVNFFYGRDGVHWKKTGFTVETSGYHHNVLQGYNSLKPGLFSAGSGSVFFHAFTYRKFC